MMERDVQNRLRLLAAHAGLPPAHNVEAHPISIGKYGISVGRLGAQGAQVGQISEGYPQIRLAAGALAIKRRRSHADDRRGRSVQRDGPAEYGRIAPKRLLQYA